MEERIVRDEQLGRLLLGLFSLETLKSEEVFESLCLYFHDDDIDFVYDALMKRGDTQSVYWLVRYLVGIERPYGFEKLFLLAQNEDEPVREEGSSGIAKISVDMRVDMLLKMLDFQWEKQIIFAVAQLGKLRIHKAVIPLIEILDKYRNNEAVCLIVMKALGNISDIRAFSSLERVASTSRDKLQEEAFHALSKLTHTFNPRYLAKYFVSDNIKVREIAYRLIVRAKDLRHEHYLAIGLSREQDEQLKAGILPWLDNIRTHRLFEIVFDLALNDPSPRVRMMAQSVIRRVKSKHTLKWLIAKEANALGRVKALLLYFLADYKSTKKVANIFVKNYRKSTEDLIRLISVESLGQMNCCDYQDFLLSIIKERNAYSYAAALSLSNMITEHGWDIINEVFSLDEKKYYLAIRIFLRFILRLPQDYHLPNIIEKQIDKFLGSSIDEVRYLAVRCLLKLRSSEKINRLLNIAQSDSSLDVRRAALRSLAQILEAHPYVLIEILSLASANPKLLTSCYTLFRNIEVYGEDFKRIIAKLLELVCQSMSGSLPVNLTFTARLMVFMQELAMKRKVAFLDYLAQSELNDIRCWTMMRVLNTSDIKQFSGFSLDFMAEQYRRASALTKIEYLDFFKGLTIKNVSIEDAVFVSLHTENELKVKAKIEEVISGWMKEAQVAYE